MKLHALLALVAALVPTARCNCRGLDRMALIKMYEALDGANWVNNLNWNTTTGTSAENKRNDPCDLQQRWFGVGFTDPCERWLDDIIGEPDDPMTEYLTRIRGAGQGCFAGRITSISMRHNNLRGNFSIAELGDLQNLTYFDLSWNEIGGAIPTEIGRINNLQALHLVHNSIQGTLPTELGTINSQGPSAATGCGIDDPCYLGEQMKLTDLALGHNSLTGTIPSQLGELVHLKVLDLASNNLTSPAPAAGANATAFPVELGRLTALQVFYLRDNALSGQLPDGLFYNMSELRYVLFEQNALSGAVPTEVGRLVKLSDLHMYGNRLDEPLPTQIGAMTVLQDLRLQDNLITGPIPTEIGKLFHMEYLDLYNNRMWGDVPPGIKDLTNLETLYLQNEHLTPVRQYYCRKRIPNVGKYSWRIMREEYREMTSVVCDDMHDVDFTFNSLQHSTGVTS